MSPFIATRPLTSAALVGAKLRAAFWSTLAAWLLVLVAIPVALKWSGTWPIVTDRAARLAAVIGTPRTIVLGLLVLAGLMAATWKQLVHSLYIGLTGRDWIARSTLVAAVAFVVFVGPVAQWVADHKTVQARLFTSIPAILSILVTVKLLAAALVGSRLSRTGLIGDGMLVFGAATWVILVFALYGVLAWLVSGPLLPRYFFMLVAILLVPLARVGAAPLALAWNRHR
jgi:hypothetical protein